jgi:hypothetical protein
MGLLDGQTQQSYYQGNDHGDYQFTSLDDIINQFMAVYVGEDKIIPKAKRVDVAFHAQRALAELSFDTLKSCKAQEITLPPSLQMTLPQDYINYTKISWVDSAGIKHLLYPTSKTSNPTKPQQDSNGDFLYNNGNLIPSGNLILNGNFHGGKNKWVLNATDFTTGGGFDTFSTAVSSDPLTLGDPETGWFFGSNGNGIGGYNLEKYNGILQHSLPILSGEKYKISFTVSGYVDGTFRCFISDENGDIASMSDVTSNGTHSQIVTAGATAGDYSPQTFYLRNINETLSATPGLNVVIDDISMSRVGNEETSTAWGNYKSGTPSENQDDYQDDTYWPIDGSRFGLDPQHAQANGSFYIDCVSGKIHFSSNISGKTVILDYISDSLGTDGEMQVHKFAEEAMYKWISHAIMAGRANVPEYQVNRFKKERFAAIRTAKLRLSNLKLEELTQILRGKSKQIKH